MNQISIRGVDDKTARQLRRQAKQKGVSLNRHVLDLLGGGATGARRVAHDDLAHLAGGWKPADAKAFASATRYFEAIDPALWK